MTKAQAAQALALLRAVYSDIESMRSHSDEWFGPFSESWVDTDEQTHIEWPNLAITGRDIVAFLVTVKGE